MKYITLSLKAIYDNFGENLKYGYIKKTDHDNQEYFDLYSDERLVCMDGEECRVIRKNDSSVLIENVNGEQDELFLLSIDEFEIGCYR